METFAISMFNTYGNKIILVHFICIFIWFTGMIATRLFLGDNLEKIKDLQAKLGKQISIMGIFFIIMIPFIFLLLLTLFILIFTMGEHINFYFKAMVWLLVTVNFLGMYIALIHSKILFNNYEFYEAQFRLASLTNTYLPLSILAESFILVMLIMLWLGVDINLFNF